MTMGEAFRSLIQTGWFVYPIRTHVDQRGCPRAHRTLYDTQKTQHDIHYTDTGFRTEVHGLGLPLLGEQTLNPMHRSRRRWVHVTRGIKKARDDVLLGSISDVLYTEIEGVP